MPGYRPSASGFTNSRTDSMNICATGLSERFFKVVMPTGCRISGSLTGSALSPGCLRGRRSEKLTTTVRKRSVANQLVSQNDGGSLHRKPRRIGNDNFFKFALDLRRAGMSTGQIETTLRSQVAFGRSPNERTVQIPSIIKSFQESFRASKQRMP